MSNDAPKSQAEAGGDVTRILERVEKGDANAAAELLPFVYDELRRLTAAKMARERPDQTVQPAPGGGGRSTFAVHIPDPASLTVVVRPRDARPLLCRDSVACRGRRARRRVLHRR